MLPPPPGLSVAGPQVTVKGDGRCPPRAASQACLVRPGGRGQPQPRFCTGAPWSVELRPVCLVPLLFVSLPATRPFCFTCVRFLPPGRQHLCAPGTKKALICLLSCSLWVEGGRETGCWAPRTTEAVRAGLQRQSGCAQGRGARRCTCARSLRCVSPGVPGPVCLDRETPVDEDFREGFLEQEASVAPESRTAPRGREGVCEQMGWVRGRVRGDSSGLNPKGEGRGGEKGRGVAAGLARNGGAAPPLLHGSGPSLPCKVRVPLLHAR